MSVDDPLNMKGHGFYCPRTYALMVTPLPIKVLSLLHSIVTDIYSFPTLQEYKTIVLSLLNIFIPYETWRLCSKKCSVNFSIVEYEQNSMRLHRRYYTSMSKSSFFDQPNPNGFNDYNQGGEKHQYTVVHHGIRKK